MQVFLAAPGRVLALKGSAVFCCSCAAWLIYTLSYSCSSTGTSLPWETLPRGISSDNTAPSDMLTPPPPKRWQSLEGLVVNPGVDPEHAGGIIYLIWSGTASGSPGRSCLGERCLDYLAYPAYPVTQTQIRWRKKMVDRCTNRSIKKLFRLSKFLIIIAICPSIGCL